MTRGPQRASAAMVTPLEAADTGPHDVSLNLTAGPVRPARRSIFLGAITSLRQRAGEIADAGAWPKRSLGWRGLRDLALRHLREAMNAADYLDEGAEHAEWCLAHGKRPEQALAEMGATVPLLPNWSDVARAAAAKAKEMRLAQRWDGAAP